MVKSRLTSQELNYFENELDLDIGYKDALDFTITTCLQPKYIVPPGPYLGYVLRIEDIGTTDRYQRLPEWGSKLDDEDEDRLRSPDTFSRYKIRIIDYDLDACIPEPPDVCIGPSTHSPAQKLIEMHQTFYAKAGVGPLQIRQKVKVDFGDYRTREDPYIVEPYYDSNGEINLHLGNTNTSEGVTARMAFYKCQSVKLGGPPDGSSLGGMFNMLGNGIKNIVLREDKTIEQREIESWIPKNTFPRECSTLTTKRDKDGRLLSNKPDPEDEDNLTYLEEEVIPRLWSELLTIDSRFEVTSVYRSDAVNKAVGGAEDKHGNPTSWHTKGLAVDFGGLSKLSPSDRNEIFFRAVNHLKNNSSKFPFLRTVIVETFRNHIHIDVYPKGSKGSCSWRKWNSKGTKMEKIA